MLKKDLLLKVRIFLIFTSTLFILGNSLHAQSVGISDVSNFTPDNSAILELQSTLRGFLPPRMTTGERDLISSPATALIIYNNTTARYEYNAGTPGAPIWIPIISNGISSVGLALPSIFNVTVPTVTTSGTLTATFNTQTANTVFAGPTTGADATPTFRLLVANDIPSLDAGKITTGILPVSRGGTGTTSLPNANIWIGDNTSNAVAYPVTGDGTLSNIGVLAVTKLRGQSISTTAPSANQILSWSGSEWAPITPAATGTITSVGLALPSEFSVSNSPVTASGTLTGAWASQNQNLVFASPNGSSGTPSFRSLVSGDIPNLDAGKITTGILPVARGGTNSGTALNNNSIMVSSSGAVVEAAALTNGQLLIGSTGLAPVAANITAGTGINVSNAAGSITLSLSSTANGASWNTAGNTGLNAASNYLGTNENVDLVFRTNSTEKMRITSGGYVGIGTGAAPGEKLVIKDGNLLLSNSGTSDNLIFQTPGGSYNTAIKTQAQTANITYTLPATQTPATTYSSSLTYSNLQNDGTGVLTWGSMVQKLIVINSGTTQTFVDNDVIGGSGWNYSYIKFTTASGNVPVTLANGPTAGFMLILSCMTGSNNGIKLNGGGSTNIKLQGAALTIIKYGIAMFIWDGSYWLLMSDSPNTP